jgi:hypothetical protein
VEGTRGTRDEGDWNWGQKVARSRAVEEFGVCKEWEKKIKDAADRDK